jgi:hypothetical protein
MHVDKTRGSYFQRPTNRTPYGDVYPPMVVGQSTKFFHIKLLELDAYSFHIP